MRGARVELLANWIEGAGRMAARYFISEALTHANKYAHTYSMVILYAPSLSLNLSFTLSHPFSLYLKKHIQTQHSDMLSLSLHTHVHAHSRVICSLSFSCMSHTCKHSVSLSRSLTHTHTHTHTCTPATHCPHPSLCHPGEHFALKASSRNWWVPQIACMDLLWRESRSAE